MTRKLQLAQALVAGFALWWGVSALVVLAGQVR
jgi:hypothetical protein